MKRAAVASRVSIHRVGRAPVVDQIDVARRSDGRSAAYAATSAAKGQAAPGEASARSRSRSCKIPQEFALAMALIEGRDHDGDRTHSTEHFRTADLAGDLPTVSRRVGLPRRVRSHRSYRFAFRTARVTGHSKQRREAVEQSRPWWRRYEEVGQHFTGRADPYVTSIPRSFVRIDLPWNPIPRFHPWRDMGDDPVASVVPSGVKP